MMPEKDLTRVVSKTPSDVSSTENPVELFGMYVAHVGINACDAHEAEDIADRFSILMGLPKKEMEPSFFSGTLVEIMKQNGRGEKGHIGFHVDDLPAAEKWFEARGFEIDESSRRLLPDGSTFLVYFKQQIAGFAIHLTVAQ